MNLTASAAGAWGGGAVKWGAGVVAGDPASTEVCARRGMRDPRAAATGITDHYARWRILFSIVFHFPWQNRTLNKVNNIKLTQPNLFFYHVLFLHFILYFMFTLQKVGIDDNLLRLQFRLLTFEQLSNIFTLCLCHKFFHKPKIVHTCTTIPSI